MEPEPLEVVWTLEEWVWWQVLDVEVVMEGRGGAVHEVHGKQLLEVVVHVYHEPKMQGFL